MRRIRVKNKRAFGNWEIICALLTVISTQIFLNFPRLMAETAGTAGWLLIIYVSVIVFILFAIISKLYEKFEGMDILDISEYIAGNIGRVLVGTILLAYLVFIISVVLREFGEDLKIITLRLSPISFVMFFFLAGMIISAFFGPEAIIRIGVLTVPVTYVAFVIILVGVLQYSDISRIMPLLGFGPKSIFIGGFPRISIYSGLILLFIFTPFIKSHKDFKKIGYISIGLSAINLTVSTLVFLLVFQYPTATENFLPMFQLAWLINYGRFFQRVESFFALLWISSALHYLSIGLFLILYVFKKTYKVEYYKPLIMPFAVILFTASLFPKNLVEAIELETKIFRNVAWVVVFGLPILLLLIGNAVRKSPVKGGEKNEKR
ncbi:MAG TPA: GerAB/ArcD/ProY family transporter [Clostridiaceae bacterium]|nr:GerAB/ArcD/ProY family transporter [Clostridiaceae bacterium]